MRHLLILLIVATLSIACKKNVADFTAINEAQAKRQDSIFQVINQKWVFQAPVTTPEVKNQLKDWKEWRDFENEITSRPLTSLSAFRKEASELALLANLLTNNIPEPFQKPEVESRIDLLMTHVNSLDMFMELDVIPEKEIALLIPNINKNYQSIADQFNEILIRKAQPKEPGENNVTQKVDTIRRATINAIPTE